MRIGIGHPGVRELVHGHVLGDFAKADREWLDPLLDTIADNAGLLVKGDDNCFMNRVTLALRDKLTPTGDDDRPPPKAPKGPEPHPPGTAAAGACQAARNRPDGRHAEEAVRRQGLNRTRSRPRA